MNNNDAILYYGAMGSSGYAIASKRKIYDLAINEKRELSWYPLRPDSTEEDEDDVYYASIKQFINKNIEFKDVIFHCTPDLWYNHINQLNIKFIDKKLIGYPVWETDALPLQWVKYCNIMSEIWVPSSWNKEVFIRSGVNVPIKIVPTTWAPGALTA